MRLRILHVPDCPNVGVLEERLSDLVDRRPGVEVVREVVGTDDDAVAAGMAGSPTLLVDGVDPFAAPEQAPSVSCRLYPDETGHLDRAPSPAQLRRALHLDPRPPVSNAGPSPATALVGWRARAAPLDPVERRVHRMILRAFAGTGRPPSRAELDQFADGDSAVIDDVLGRLHRADVIRLDPAGQLAVAYPFSATPTRHRVRIRDGADAYAMCAVDALGISAMLGVDTEISSTDPLTAQPVTVQTVDGESSWRPDTAVVIVAAAAEGAEGPSADSCCSSINFFASRQTADVWNTSHSRLAAGILDPADAERFARRIFESLDCRRRLKTGPVSPPEF